MTTPKARPSFAEQRPAAPPGTLREFASFLADRKRWWLAPVLVTLLLIGALIAIGGSAAAPFIYTLF